MPVNFDWKKEMISDSVSNTKMDASVYKIKDVWAKKAVGTTAKVFIATVPSHDVMVLRLSK